MPSRSTRAVLALALVGAAAVAPSAWPAAARGAVMRCTGSGRERICTVPVSRGVRVRNNTIRVVVPADYGRTRQRYPVVYVLHGVADSEKTWTDPTKGDLARLTARCAAIFVMPDAGSGTEAGWYSNWLDGSYQWETFHIKNVIPAVDATFRTRGAVRAVAGVSMGGFGALSYTARHPRLFRATAAYSAFVDTLFLAPASGLAYQVSGQNSVYSTGAPGSGVWGEQQSNRDVWAAHNPYDLADRLRNRPLYLAVGDGRPGGPAGDDPAKAANYFTEIVVRQQNDRLADKLAGSRGFVDARYSGGYHDWVYNRRNFADSLRVLMPPLGAASAGCGR